MIRPNPIQFDQLDWESLTPEGFELLPEHISQAVDLSQAVPNPTQQWQAYLNALAVFGFESWLESRSITVQRDQCSIFDPAVANLLETVCNLQVGAFKVCLITMGSVGDRLINVPKVVIDLPDWAAHFYVLVEVLEEQEEARIYGFLPRHLLVQQIERSALAVDADWSYTVPTDWFNPQPDELLLHLRCLEPSAIPLPVVTEEVVSIPLLRQKLTNLQQHSPDLPYARLTWAEVTTFLSQIDLVRWWYDIQTSRLTTENVAQPSPPIPDTAATSALPLPISSPSPSPTLSPSSLTANLTTSTDAFMQRAMNVGLWLRDRLDEVAEEFSWVLMPALAPIAVEMRAVEEFQGIVTELQQTGMAIAPAARGAYRDLRWGNTALRLYAAAWPLPVEEQESGQTPEWTLLLVLGAQPDSILPVGVGIQVQDENKLLMERTLTEADQDAYLYARVIGSWDEQFWVTIRLPNGTSATLPPFTFR
jgi:hypothetical protein